MAFDLEAPGSDALPPEPVIQGLKPPPAFKLFHVSEKGTFFGGGESELIASPGCNNACQRVARFVVVIPTFFNQAPSDELFGLSRDFDPT